MSREELILSLAPQVNIITNEMYNQYPAFYDRDDVMIEGWIGAIQAVDRFTPEQGCKLKTFAEHRIRGRILDFYRSVDLVSRGMRKRIKAGLEEEPCVVPLEEVQHYL